VRWSPVIPKADKKMASNYKAPRIVDVLVPKYEDPKEPYAFFGLAAYYVQCFEQSLILIIVALKATNRIILTTAEMEHAFERLDKQTLGILIKQLRDVMVIDDKFSETLAYLLEKRNYIMHHFFERNSEKWYGDASRRAMIDELRDLAQAFQDGDHMIVDLFKPLWARLGVTEESIQREMQKLMSEASA
jgi:hypothetical protein